MSTNDISKQNGIKISEKQYVAGYDKEAFSRFIRLKRKGLISKDGKKGISTRELADMIKSKKDTDVLTDFSEYRDKASNE